VWENLIKKRARGGAQSFEDWGTKKDEETSLAA
jgi:hypothetical protein